MLITFKTLQQKAFKIEIEDTEKVTFYACQALFFLKAENL